MYAVEFQAQIKNGTIEIPEAYRSRCKERVRVILLAEEESTTVTLIDQLLTIHADTLSNCLSVHQALALASGHSIAFEKMRSVEVLHVDARFAAPARAAVVITWLEGSTITESVGANCDLFGYNALGRFESRISAPRRVSTLKTQRQRPMPRQQEPSRTRLGPQRRTSAVKHGKNRA